MTGSSGFRADKYGNARRLKADISYDINEQKSAIVKT